MNGLGDKTRERLGADPGGMLASRKECVEKRVSRIVDAMACLRLRLSEMNSGGTS